MTGYIERALAAIERGRRFVTHDVWHIGAPGEEIPHGFIIKHIRVAILLVQNLVRDALTLRAAALTFATALGIIPFLALVFYVVQQFHIEEEIYKYLADALLPASDASSAPAQAPHSMEDLADLVFQGVGQLESKDGEAFENPVKKVFEYAQEGADPENMGLAWIVFVIAAAFGLLRNIESAFSTIWGLKRTRSWYRIFSDYLVLMFAMPFVVALVISVTAILENEQFKAQLGVFAPGLRGAQYLIIWLVFTAMYFLIPNTRVRVRYAVLGGVVGGTLWCLLSWAFVKFEVGVTKYSLFFSAFAQVPILLMWVYFSWLILLFGAELTFAYQYEKTFAMERLARGASYAYREALGLWAMAELGKRFDRGEPPRPAAALAEDWNVPVGLLTEILDTLAEGGLVSPCNSGDAAYQPGRSLSRISVGDIVTCLRESGRDPSALRQEKAFQPLLDELFDAQTGRASETLQELVDRLNG